MKSPEVVKTSGPFVETANEMEIVKMKSSTVTEDSSQMKATIEGRLDANGWRWSRADSLSLDVCVVNMEVSDESGY